MHIYIYIYRAHARACREANLPPSLTFLSLPLPPSLSPPPLPPATTPPPSASPHPAAGPDPTKACMRASRSSPGASRWNSRICQVHICI